MIQVNKIWKIDWKCWEKDTYYYWPSKKKSDYDIKIKRIQDEISSINILTIIFIDHNKFKLILLLSLID